MDKTINFIEKANKIHKNKYDYSKVEYINNETKVCIICPEHGEFWQTPHNHLHGQKCPNCALIIRATKRLNDRYTFIWKAIQKHGYKYNYSKVDYKGNKTKVCIICPEHGEFWQRPDNHLNGSECLICGNYKISDKLKDSLSDFIKKAKEIHGDKYDYSKVKYIKSDVKVCIICSKHGEFWQTPEAHLQKQGCPVCKESRLEKEIRAILLKNKINFEYQKKFDWLKYKNPLSLDFYLPDYNVAIECQGIQHFKPVDYFGGSKEFKKLVKRDKIKKELCEHNNIRLLYYSDFNYSENILNQIKNE